MDIGEKLFSCFSKIFPAAEIRGSSADFNPFQTSAMCIEHYEGWHLALKVGTFDNTVLLVF